MNLNPLIFREYDIRGVVAKDLNETVAEQIGRAFGTYVRRRLGREGWPVVVGQDNRLSSPNLAYALMDGLLKTGVDVVDAGIVPTPVLYFGLHTIHADGGVMVTGSHNPPEFNGFKIVLDRRPVYGKALKELRSLAEQGEFVTGQGELRREDFLPAYREAIKRRIFLKRRLRVAVDCGNGTAGLVAPLLLATIGCQVRELYGEPDGRFPHHHPDPTVDANLEDLRRVVVEEGLDLGVAFDGDADRLGVVDDRGQIVRGDSLLLLFARDFLARSPGAKVIFDVKCSQALVELIHAWGGLPIMWKTGHSLIKERMREEEAHLAGEMSGHFFFMDDYFGYDDGIYAACRLAALLSRHEGSLSQWVDELPRNWSTPELRLPCSDERKFQIVEEARVHFRTLGETVELDGVRFATAEGWGLLRASNTQPALVVRCESPTPEGLARLERLLKDWLQSRGVTWPEA